ncbi:hypothetical protein ACFL6S_04305 [Candidatus Poribacteria bacterium]
MRYLAILITLALMLGSCGDSDIQDLVERHNADMQDPAIVIASADVEEATIGDKIEYTVTIILDSNLTDVQIPQFGENLGGFAIKDFGQSSREFEGKNVEERWYRLDTYFTGTYTIPAPVVRFTGGDGEESEVEGNEVSVEIVSVIEDGEEPEDIKDIAGPVDLPMDYTPHILLGVGILVIIGAGLTTYILLRRREREVEEAPPRPAHEIAYEQLQGIAEAELVQARETDRYYVLLSAVVRQYLENRFGLHAPEMTTEEFLQAAASEPVDDSTLLQDHRTLLQDFLTESDLVKFARYGPDEEQMNSAFGSAKRFVDETRADVVRQLIEQMQSTVEVEDA